MAQMSIRSPSIYFRCSNPFSSNCLSKARLWISLTGVFTKILHETKTLQMWEYVSYMDDIIQMKEKLPKNYVDNLKTNTVPYNLSGASQQATLASGGLEHIGVYGSPKKPNQKISSHHAMLKEYLIKQSDRNAPMLSKWSSRFITNHCVGNYRRANKILF